MASLAQGFDLAKRTLKDFSDDECATMAAALSYYTVFAPPPLLILLIMIAGAVWDPEDVRGALEGQFAGLMGPDAAQTVHGMITQADRPGTGGALATVVSVVALLFGATGTFIQLQSALNRTWEVAPDPEQGGIKNFITKRFLSLGMVLGIAFLLMVSLALTTAISAFGGMLGGGLSKPVLAILEFVLSFGVITLLFAATFKVLPDAAIAWRDVWVGAVATAVLFMIGKFLLGFYLGRSDPGSAFGAAGSLALMLVWIYYAAMILLLGAEFTQAWVEHRGATIEPEPGAVRVVERTERAGGPRQSAPGESSAEPSSDAAAESAGQRAPHRPATARAGTAGAREAPRRNETIADVHRESAETRARMSSTVAELEERTRQAVADAKEKLDPVHVLRDHPWPALAAAFGAGVLLSTSRADRKAAAAALRAAEQAPHVAADAAKRAVGGGASAAATVAGKLRGRSHGDEHSSSGDGVLGRIKGRFARAVHAQIDELGSEMRRAADAVANSSRRADM